MRGVELIRIIAFLLLILTFYGINAEATTYYVRTNGSTATNCTGTADADYDGSGTGEACAFNHPNWALELQGQTAGAMTGGDDLVIVNGTYTIGCLGSGTDCRDANYNITVSGSCDNDFPNDCYPNPVPDGSSGDHTTIKGCTTSGCSVVNCSDSPGTCPKLTGQGRTLRVLSLASSDYVDIQDIEITDGASCGSAHPTTSCGALDSDELTALDGLYVEGATNITTDGVWIHGIYRYGIYGGNLTGTNAFSHTKIDWNGLGGWNLDTCANDGTCGIDSGTITFTGAWAGTPARSSCSISSNGCIEDASSVGNAIAQGCYDNYGDGLGSSNTAGAWSFEGCDVSHNTSDGVDLLYLNKGSQSGGTLTIRESRMEGNSGNQVKSSNEMDIQSSFLIGNCNYFYNQTFTYGINDSGLFTSWCRGAGNTIEITFYDNDTSPKIIGNTITGNGDVIIDTNGTCTTGTDVIVKNNNILGGRQAGDDTSAWNGAGDNDTTAIYYDAGVGTCDTDFTDANNICMGLKEGSSACNGSGSNDTAVGSDVFNGTLLQGPHSSPGYYTSNNYVDQLNLKSGGTAIDFADETVTGAVSVDYFNNERPASWDNGALEYGSTPAGGGGGGGGSTSSVHGYVSGSSKIGGGSLVR